MRSSLARHSGGVMSRHRTRPASSAARSAPTMRSMASLASRVRSPSAITTPTMLASTSARSRRSLSPSCSRACTWRLTSTAWTSTPSIAPESPRSGSRTKSNHAGRSPRSSPITRAGASAPRRGSPVAITSSARSSSGRFSGWPNTSRAGRPSSGRPPARSRNRGLASSTTRSAPRSTPTTAGRASRRSATSWPGPVSELSSVGSPVLIMASAAAGGRRGPSRRSGTRRCG